jgi:hypothetical protein
MLKVQKYDEGTKDERLYVSGRLIDLVTDAWYYVNGWLRKWADGNWHVGYQTDSELWRARKCVHVARVHGEPYQGSLATRRRFVAYIDLYFNPNSKPQESVMENQLQCEVITSSADQHRCPHRALENQSICKLHAFLQSRKVVKPAEPTNGNGSEFVSRMVVPASEPKKVRKTRADKGKSRKAN